jgi:hypothetical protein
MQWKTILVAAGVALAAVVALSGCGPCGDVKRADLKTIPRAQLDADMAVFEKAADGEGAEIEFELDKLAKHPEAVQVFESLGYVGKKGGHLAFTRKGLTNSRDLRYSSRGFMISKQPAHSPVQFTYESEQVQCNEGHSIERTYGFDDRIAPLTPLGDALVRHGLLYRGTADTKPVRWKGPRELLHETFYFEVIDPSGTAQFGGEGLDFSWGRSFAGD